MPPIVCQLVVGLLCCVTFRCIAQRRQPASNIDHVAQRHIECSVGWSALIDRHIGTC